MKNLVAYVVMIAIPLLLIFELWLAFTKGYVHNIGSWVGGRATRAKSPIAFWATVVIFALLLIFFLWVMVAMLFGLVPT